MSEIAVLNKSSMSDEDVAYAAKACDYQLREHCWLKWDGVIYTPVRFYSTERDLPVASDLSRIMIIADTLDVEGALGYHTMDPLIRGIVRAGDGMSVTLSHECLEMACDPTADEWVKMPDGREVALEVCDPVEANTYTIDTTILGKSLAVPVSDFVLPNWFDAKAGPGDRNWLGTLHDSFVLDSQGYMLVMNLDGSVDDVWADQHDPVAAARSRAGKTLNSTSRSYHRGLR